MKDVTVPQNDIVRRPQTVPEPYVAPLRDDEADRISKSPFFERPKNNQADTQKPKGSGSKIVLWALLFALLMASGFFIANYFATATIEVTPVTRNATLNINLTAIKESEEEEDLTFQFMSLVEEKSKDVPATIEKKIQKKASGKVVIYNSYNGDSQRLIKNTRLESPDNKIFRIDQSVVVPGAKVVDGKTVPGSVEALVYADVAGKEYNIGTSNFTIPGFKGDPRYSKFSAASKPDSPISGGFSGTVKVPSDEAIRSAEEELKLDLKKEAIEKARAQVPGEVSFFPGSVVVKLEEVPQDYSSGAPSKVSMRATVSVFFFDTVSLTKKITELTLPEADKNNPFLIPDMATIQFSFVDPVDNVVLSDLSKIKFSLGGTADFVGQIDAEKIRTDLAGKNKKDFTTIIAGEKNIGEGTNAVVRPMWKKVFPSDTSKIAVKIMTK